MISKKTFSLFLAVIIATCAVILCAVNLFIVFSNRRIVPLILIQSLLVYAYPLCGAILIRKKGPIVGIIYILALCAADFFLSTLAYPLSLVFRQLYFSFINACKAELAMACIGIISMRWTVYVFLVISLAAFFGLEYLRTRLYPRFESKKAPRIIAAAVESFIVIILFELGTAIHTGFYRYSNSIVLGIVVLLCIIGTILFYFDRNTKNSLQGETPYEPSNTQN